MIPVRTRTPAEEFERAVRFAVAARTERQRAFEARHNAQRKRDHERVARRYEAKVRQIADRALECKDTPDPLTEIDFRNTV